jgi:4-amino-4-deoxy-L-arabinose transferase-like glycosyltransferase
VAAVAAVVGWYVFALLILHPLTDAPVVDSWLYGSSVRRFLRTGEIRFAGYTQAMPIAQVVYGVAWARIFGGNSASLEISVVVLAILCGLMFHALAIRCGAPRWQALAATGLLICNPCFTFLSFSFMTEIPFLTAMIATHLAFARALGRREQLWLWLSAAAAVVGFLIRPFAAMAIAGCVGATLLYDGDLRANFRDRAQWLNPRLIKLIAPFAAALAICVGLWVWLTVLGPKPWQVQFNENRFNYIFMVPLANYLRAGVLGPVLYLGTVLSPLALLQLATPPRCDRRCGNFRRRAHPDVDRRSAARDARVQLLRGMAKRVDTARRGESIFMGWRMAVRVSLAGELRRGGIGRGLFGYLEDA